MSKEKEEATTRIYTIPLARAWIAPRHHRAIRAINMIKEFAAKHMKSAEIKIATELNELIWRRGIRFPPRRVMVEMLKDKDGVVSVSLVKPSPPARPVPEIPPPEEALVSVPEVAPTPLAPVEEPKLEAKEVAEAPPAEKAKPRKKPRKKRIEEEKEGAAAPEIAVPVPRG